MDLSLCFSGVDTHMGRTSPFECTAFEEEVHTTNSSLTCINVLVIRETSTTTPKFLRRDATAAARSPYLNHLIAEVLWLLNEPVLRK